MIIYLVRSRGGGRGGRLLAIVFLILVTLFPGHAVYAQDPTNTPYPIYETPEYNLTPGACPIGTPLPTPLSLDYYERCGFCITPQVPVLTPINLTPIAINTLPVYDLLTFVPTNTPDGTGTPGVTLTPEATLTPTLNPNEVLENFQFSGIIGPLQPDYLYSWSEENKTYSTTGTPTGIFNNLGIYPNYYLAGLYWRHYGHMGYRSGAQGYTHYAYTTIKNQSCTSGNVFLDFDIDGIYETQLTLGGVVSFTYGSNNHVDTDFDNTIVFNIKVMGECTVNDDVRIYSGFGGTKVGQDYDQAVEFIWYDGEFIPEPEATPTPTPEVGFCNEYDYQSSDQVVGVPEITVTQGDCVVIIPDFHINLPAVGEVIPAVNWDVNGMSFCPKWVDFGDVEVLDFVIPVDIIAIPAVMMLVVFIFNM